MHRILILLETGEGWLYLASIMDLYTRKIVGWACDSRMTKELVIQTFQRAINREQPKGSLLHHSDRGSQYASNDYQALLEAHEIEVSMSRKGNCYDNAVIESFHSLLKKEWLYPRKFKTRNEGKQAIFEYIECFYNRKLSRAALGYVSPCEFEAQYYANQRQVAA